MYVLVYKSLTGNCCTPAAAAAVINVIVSAKSSRTVVSLLDDGARQRFFTHRLEVEVLAVVADVVQPGLVVLVNKQIAVSVCCVCQSVRRCYVKVNCSFLEEKF